jgi:hypothetical protein
VAVEIALEEHHLMLGDGAHATPHRRRDERAVGAPREQRRETLQGLALLLELPHSLKDAQPPLLHCARKLRAHHEELAIAAPARAQRGLARARLTVRERVLAQHVPVRRHQQHRAGRRAHHAQLVVWRPRHGVHAPLHQGHALHLVLVPHWIDKKHVSARRRHEHALQLGQVMQRKHRIVCTRGEHAIPQRGRATRARARTLLQQAVILDLAPAPPHSKRARARTRRGSRPRSAEANHNGHEKRSARSRSE